jgi:hypothetical protein
MDNPSEENKGYQKTCEAYSETDICLTYKKMKSLFDPDRERFQRLQEINDQAYYVMLFAQFDRKVRDLLEESMSMSRDEIKSLTFMERIEELKIGENTRDYNLINQLYADRCKIAHSFDHNIGRVNIAERHSMLIDLEGRLGGWMDENLFEIEEDLFS